MAPKGKLLWVAFFIVLTCSVSASIALQCDYVLRFDGVDDLTVVPHDESLSLNEFTLEVWAKIDTLDMFRSVFIQKNNQQGNFGNYSLGVLGSETSATPGTLEYVHQTTTGNWSCRPNRLMKPGVWTYVAVTFSGGYLRWYINGSQEAEFFTETQPIQSISNLFFGSGYGNSDCLQGELDEVKIWNVDLTSAEIGENATGPVSPDSPGLVGYWNFNEALNDQHIYDASPFANHGTLGASLAVASDDPIRVGPPCGRIIYVDDDATGANSGTSWVNAYVYLQDALVEAQELGESAVIHVAQGIYKPDRGASETPGDRGATFQLINGVTLMGGYAGVGAEDPNCRSPEVYKTVLSGDLQGNDNVSEGTSALVNAPSRADNSDHVITGSGVTSTAILEGFIIEGGRSDDKGGGMFNDEGSPKVRYCTFRLNGATHSGGGMYNWSSNAEIYRCVFSNNYAVQGGGVWNGTITGNPNVKVVCCIFQNNQGESGGSMLNWGNCNVTVEYCSFLRNNAGDGGGIRTANQSGTVKVIKCTFSSNSARLNGGALHSVTTQQGLIIVSDCIFRNNEIGGSGRSGGAVYMDGDGVSQLKGCRLEYNYANEHGGGAYSAGGERTFDSCQFVGNTARKDGGGVCVKDGSITMTNCAIIRSNMANQGGAMAILNSDFKLHNCTIVGNSSTSTLPSNSHGIWYNGHNLTITNSIIWSPDVPVIVLQQPPNFPVAIDYSCVPEEYSGYGSGNISTDPKTYEHGALMPGSLCIDAGNDALVPAGLLWDVLGNPRFVDDPVTVNTGLGIVDMGAFEYTTGEYTTDASTSSDLGDAPDSSNSFPGTSMTAYPKYGPQDVHANYPSVYKVGSPPYGPIHWHPGEVAFLGVGVTLENEADIGPDADPTNNLSPRRDYPDRDEGDDGIILPLALPHCGEATFDYIVTLVSEPPGPLYVNVWCDWNRDGDWDDTLTCPDGTTIPEWAVQNQEPVLENTDKNVVTTPPFFCWHPENTCNASYMWLRITLSERPWQAPGSGLGSGGAGDVNGYDYGETEDHYICLDEELAQDWGDAPDDICLQIYPTLLIHDGARHLIGGPWFGVESPDSEYDGQPHSNAKGDDTNGNDDEDGMLGTPVLIPGEMADINIIVSGGGGHVRVWIDFDHDCTWEPEELIQGGDPWNSFLPNGSHILTFLVPENAAPGTTFARFRISSEYGLEPTGPAGDGEVEDHPITISSPPPTGPTCNGSPTCSGLTCNGSPTCSGLPTCNGLSCNGVTCVVSCGVSCGVGCNGTSMVVPCSLGMGASPLDLMLYGPDSNYPTMDRPVLGSPIMGSGPTTTPECRVVFSLQKDWLITNWTCPAIKVNCPSTAPIDVSASDEESHEKQVKISRSDGDDTKADG